MIKSYSGSNIFEHLLEKQNLCFKKDRLDIFAAKPYNQLRTRRILFIYLFIFENFKMYQCTCGVIGLLHRPFFC